MDRSSGLKECPRCGLRNRQGAHQCDFCGWDFNAASDDWMGQVSDLERISNEIGISDLDPAIRSRIELTMKRPAEVAIAERKTGAHLEMPPHLSLDDHGDVLSQPTAEIAVEAEPEPAPVIAEEVATVEAQRSIVPPEAVAGGAVAPAAVEEPRAAASSIPARKAARMPQFVPGGLLAMGLGVYALDIYVVSAGILTGALAWGISILASLLMAYAVIRFLPMITKGNGGEDVTVLCPVCHEQVSDDDGECPSCGVRFREAPSRE